MAFVYIYSDQNGHVKYVGIAKGDCFEHLNSRITAHAREPRFRNRRFNIKFIAGLSQTDAEFLEAHYINKTMDTNWNEEKRRWGVSSLIDREPDAWTEWKPGLHGVAPRIVFRDSFFTCSCCGQSFMWETRKLVSCELSGANGPSTSVSLFYCADCADDVLNLAVENLFLKPDEIREIYKQRTAKA